jgi:hypothetical protein
MGTEPDFEHGEPAPKPGTGPSMHDLILENIKMQRFMSEQHLANGVAPINSLATLDAAAERIKRRKEYGAEKYKTILQANNGRDSLNDLLDEMEDVLAYSRQHAEEFAQSEIVDLDVFNMMLAQKRNVFLRLLDIYLDLIEMKILQEPAVDSAI